MQNIRPKLNQDLQSSKFLYSVDQIKSVVLMSQVLRVSTSGSDKAFLMSLFKNWFIKN